MDNNWITTFQTADNTMTQYLPGKDVKVVIDYRARKIGTYIAGKVNTDTLLESYLPADHKKYLETVERAAAQLNNFQ